MRGIVTGLIGASRFAHHEGTFHGIIFILNSEVGCSSVTSCEASGNWVVLIIPRSGYLKQPSNTNKLLLFRLFFQPCLLAIEVLFRNFFLPIKLHSTNILKNELTSKQKWSGEAEWIINRTDCWQDTLSCGGGGRSIITILKPNFQRRCSIVIHQMSLFPSTATKTSRRPHVSFRWTENLLWWVGYS